MARRYQIDELLWLRSSPLVTKPASLPPVEEWMGCVFFFFFFFFGSCFYDNDGDYGDYEFGN